MTQDKDVTEKLLDHNRQQLSALIDDALSPDEARFLLRRLQHDESLAQCLSRWQLCGDILRGHAHAPAPAGFAQRVATAIAGDTATAADARPATGWRSARWGSGLALAASVAVIALFVARQTPELASPDGGSQPAQVASQAQPQTPAPATVVASVQTSAPTNLVPQPRQPDAPGSAGEIAAVAAVAALPRRAAERRSRAQSQRAALRTSSRRAVEPQIAVAAAAPGPAASPPAVQDAMVATAAASPAIANPFTPKAGIITTRPWPRALLPGAAAGSGFSVDYGRRQADPGAFYPFQLRAVPELQPAQDRAGQVESGQAEGGQADRADATSPDNGDTP